MDTLLIALIVAMLVELGDRTNFLALSLGQRFGPQWTVMTGIALAAIASNLIAAYLGAAIAGMLSINAAALLTGIAILLAGIGGFRRFTAPKPEAIANIAPLPSAFWHFFIRSFGDKTYFLTFALAARMDQPLLAASGAALGMTFVNLGPVVLANEWTKVLPLSHLRRVVAIFLSLAGLWIIASILIFQ